MSTSEATLTVSYDGRVEQTLAVRVCFSAHQCFRFDGYPGEVAALRALAAHLKSLPGLAIYGDGPLLGALLKHDSGLASDIRAVIVDAELGCGSAEGLLAAPMFDPQDIPVGILHVFLCETMTVPRMRMRMRLPSRVAVIEPDVLVDVAPDSLPFRAWSPIEKNIYPIDLREIEFRSGLDLLVVDCPSRNLALMPNGLGYLDNALKKTSIAYQIADVDIIAYHRYHLTRLYDLGGTVVLRSGRVLPNDPWLAEHYDVWTTGSETNLGRQGHTDVIDYFRPLINEVVAKIIKAAPKIVGFSIQQCNEAMCREVAEGVKAGLPDVVIVVGGFSCYNPDVGRRIFPQCDYMCIGESELTVGPLMEALSRGERPVDLPGILSRFDTPRRQYVPGPIPHNLDRIEFPKYEWTDLSLYRNYNGYQLTPVIASRGCRWSRCTFCAERFYWRIRSPKNFVDELEWLVDQGCTLFMFNESDLNGMPDKLLEICDEIMARGLQERVKLTGQLRIHKKADRDFYRKLRAAGFVALRFGVDAFSENTLRLQKKGYTVDMVRQNLRDCWEAGIYTEVNWVIGVPGETDKDIEEGIQLILENRRYIGRVCNINPLILLNGGVYWIDPEEHGIVFRAPKEELYGRFPRAIPAEYWYSVNPHIDAQVRKQRFERIVVALHDAGFPVGPWAEKVIEDVKHERDPMRAGSARRLAGAGQDPVVAPSPRARRIQKTIPIGEQPHADVESHALEIPAPRLVREHGGFKIHFYNGWYYGVPLARGEVDLASVDAEGMAGIPRASSVEQLVVQIDSAARWANSRGHFEDQERQRAAGSYFRADSLLGDGYVNKELDPVSEILRFQGEFFAVRDVYPWQRPLQGNTPLRRLALKVIPQEMLLRLRCVVHAEFERLDRQGSRGDGPRKPLSVLGKLWLVAQTSLGSKPARSLGPRNDGTKVLFAMSKGVEPELMWSIGNYNVVQFDGNYYGIPVGVLVDWKNDFTGLPGLLRAKSAQELLKRILKDSPPRQYKATSSARSMGPAGERSALPKQLGSLHTYNVVEYEGWIYGLPQSLGPIDLREVDVIETEGVIRDVSRDVVEQEIIERSAVASAVS